MGNYQYCFVDQLVCFQNKFGKRTQEASDAKRWVKENIPVVAYIFPVGLSKSEVQRSAPYFFSTETNSKEKYFRPTVTAEVTSVYTSIDTSIDTDGYNFAFVTKDNVKYIVKKKLPKVRFITPIFFCDKSYDASVLVKSLLKHDASVLKEEIKKGDIVRSLNEAQALLDKNRSLVCLYKEDNLTWVETGPIAKIDFEKLTIESKTGVKYFVQ